MECAVASSCIPASPRLLAHLAPGVLVWVQAQFWCSMALHGVFAVLQSQGRGLGMMLGCSEHLQALQGSNACVSCIARAGACVHRTQRGGVYGGPEEVGGRAWSKFRAGIDRYGHAGFITQLSSLDCDFQAGFLD